jgi:opacity protein-like surface antigen
MKKYILFLGLSVVPLLSNAGMPGNFYVGAGLVSTKPTQSSIGVVTRDSAANLSGAQRLRPSSNFFANGRLMAGYHKNFNPFFLGGEAFYQLADKSINTKSKDVLTPTGGYIDTIKASVRRNYTAGATVKIGKYFTDRVGAYLSGGALVSQFKTSVSGFNKTSSQQKTVFGGVFGGGVMGHLSESFLLKLEYGYEYYKEYGTNSLQSTLVTGSNVGNTLTSKMNYQSVTLSISYLI